MKLLQQIIKKKVKKNKIYDCVNNYFLKKFFDIFFIYDQTTVKIIKYFYLLNLNIVKNEIIKSYIMRMLSVESTRGIADLYRCYFFCNSRNVSSSILFFNYTSFCNFH